MANIFDEVESEFGRLLPKTTIEMESGFENIPSGSKVRTKLTDTGEAVEGYAYPDLGQVAVGHSPLPSRKPNPTISNIVGSFGTGANRAASGLIGMPVNALGTVMGIDKPVGGTQWLQENVFPPEYPTTGGDGRFARAIGEQAPGLMIPGGIAMKAGKAAIPAMKGALASSLGAGTGVGVAREIAPNSAGGELAGALIGGIGAGGLASAAYRTPHLDSFIKDSLNRAIRPSTSGKNFASDISKYEDKGVGAIKQIVYDSRERGVSAPTTVEEFAQTVENLKGKVFEKYHAKTLETNGAGAMVNLRPLLTELQEVIDDPVTQDNFPGVVKTARELMERYAGRGEYTPPQAERAITQLNSVLKAHYKGQGSGMTQENANMLEGIATKLRQLLDKTVTEYDGPGYQQLKNEYGQLRAIENDIVKRTGVHKRANKAGFFDLSDMFSASKLVTGLAKADPATAAAGGAMLAIKQGLKHFNNPDAIVKKLFTRVDKYLPEKQVFAGPGERNLNFTMRPYEGEVIPGRNMPVPAGPLRNTGPQTIEGQFEEVAMPLGGGERAGMLTSPRNSTPVQVPWNPVNRPGAGAERMPNIQSASAKQDLEAMAKALYEKGFPPSQIQDMIRQELRRR